MGFSKKSEKSLETRTRKWEADLLIQNARIRTLDLEGTLGQSLAARNGLIISVGSDEDFVNLVGPQTEIMDMGGRTVVPGFIDAHEHLSNVAEIPLQLDLSSPPPKSIRELLERIKSEAEHLPPGQWIRGIRYDDTLIGEGRPLSKEDLDAAAPNHPVVVTHVSFHWGVVNSEALRRGEIDESTPDPKGGKLGREAKTGRLTGQVLEAGLYRFGLEGLTREPMIVPPFGRDVRKKALLDAAGMLNAAGLTGVHDAVVSPSYVTSYLDLGTKHLLPMRVNMLIPYIFLPEVESLGLLGNWGNEWVRCTGLKIIVDGAIAGRTAALREGYSHDPDDHGILLFDHQDELNDLVKRIHSMGYQVCLHANGDIAIEMALDAIQKAQSEYPRVDPRHRIEHCTIVNESILRRMRDLEVMALPFGSYLWQHGDKLVKYYGKERAEAMFSHKSFLDAGVRVAGSSDHPAGLYPPLLGVQSMVTRKTPSGDLIGPGQRISIDEAFKMYTVCAAYASFEENIKGSLTVGRLADLVVLDRDPWTIRPDDIGQIGVDMTILGGKVVYRRE